jgi:hypothetical protein
MELWRMTAEKGKSERRMQRQATASNGKSNGKSNGTGDDNSTVPTLSAQRTLGEGGAPVGHPGHPGTRLFAKFSLSLAGKPSARNSNERPAERKSAGLLVATRIT